MATPPEDSSSHDAQQLLSCAKQLMSEVLTFSDHFADMAQTSSGDGSHVAAGALNYLKQQLKSEIQGLEGVLKKHQSNDPMAPHCTSSTNLPFYEALWNVAKESRDIVALRKWVSCGQYQGKDLLSPGNHIIHHPGDSIPSKHTTTLVDIISDGGQTWVKIAAITGKRVLWDMTKLGWAVGADDSDDEDDEDDFDDIPLFKVAKSLADSASVHRIRGRRPKVQLVLPRIASGESRDIDLVLNRIRKLGIQVQCSNEVSPLQSKPLTTSTLLRMAPSPFARFSGTLNMDTSVLIALISDFSHGPVAQQSWFSSMQKGHLANEAKHKIASTWIYPALSGHKLICTEEAAKTCREIVSTIGTETELARLNLVLYENPSMTPDIIRREFRVLSKYDMSENIQLPVQIMRDTASTVAEIPSEALEALQDTTEPTKSVFAYGWASQLTTITSNGVGVNNLTRQLEDRSYQGTWPSIWLCPFSRSLVGVPKHVREAAS
ncbi:uncharacterized protein JN550_002977 [Neoarthrinium moseri]|uniref:uncharacterized protein n=1 Tax=Neoarthrinium moseri TaxID=1658444 RepID=UPI001FDD2457|nr:uncharacterized protein JN550_002977 [Neoarthrinium moseri]KAI1873708.1 hypothetical protein JN550_002977 [Neoarthrinium moseri]